MRHFLITLGILGGIFLSNCTYVPIPLPQEYKLASEAYVNDQVSAAMSSEIGAMIDSMRTETSKMVGLALDSLITSQSEIREMVLANQALQADLETLMREQSAGVTDNTTRLNEMDRLVEEMNILQNELIKHVENMPLVTLTTIQKAIASYRARPIQVSRPEPAKIPAPVVDKKPAPTTPVEPVDQAPEEPPAEPVSTPPANDSDEMMEPDSVGQTGN
ncbi:MAG: hypothetical protein K9N34_01170 [Candidatus Marinimicrobia bacterium]|nr:hypothetical protein [Candidatus Neomarinimicrobiota bacterium]MCF7839245.1 hypothetical protein [Candidatus Neomarinimicrobiota bacterium]